MKTTAKELYIIAIKTLNNNKLTIYWLSSGE